MADVESRTGKSLVVFDRFYKNPAFDETHDSISDVVADRHRVLANAYSLSNAVATLLAIKDGELETPEVIVTGGMLEDELEYLGNPQVIKTTETKTVRGLRGKKEKTVDVLRFALPIADAEGGVRLPLVRARGIADNMYNAHLFREGWQRTGSSMALSGFVIGHLSKELLGDRQIKVIGHSSFPSFGATVPIDAYVNKQDSARSLWLAGEIETE